MRLFPQKVRTRLTALYAALFLAGGTVLLGLTFGLVSASLNAGPSPLPGGKTSSNAALARVCKSANVHGTLTGNLAAKCRAVFQAGARAGTSVQRDRTLHDLQLYSVLGLGLLTLASGGLGWFVSGRVLRPVRTITDTARRASEQHLGERLTLSGPRDELKELADTFDDMLDRLDAAFTSQRQFVANASHELRTPLTAMRTAIDVTLGKPERTSAHLETMALKVRGSVDHAEKLIEALLTLANSNQGLDVVEFVDLATAAEDALEAAGPGIGEWRLAVTCDLQPAEVMGDRVLLERMITNLVDNAVRHNIAGGWVRLRTGTESGGSFVEVKNSGTGVQEDQVPSLFEPFCRLEGRTGEGVGLGLSIVKSVTEAHGAHLSVHSQAEGGLSVAVVIGPSTQTCSRTD